MNYFLLILMCFSLVFSGCGASQPITKSANIDINPLALIVKFYQGPLDHLSSVRYGKCPMHPSCSAYSVESFRQYGPLTGWMMTCDRLMRCGRDETATAKQILTPDGPKYLDPVSQNDFWADKR